MVSPSIGFFYTDFEIFFVDGGALVDAKDYLTRAEAAFGPNYPKLQKIKRKYDPDNIFNKWFPIVPT